MVVEIFLSLAGVVKVRFSKTQVDNAIFALHYRWTTTFCFLCCALVAATDLFGDPIKCLDAEKAQTTFCWISSTYTINTTLDKGPLYQAFGSSYSGIGTPNKDNTITFHAYYQWVPVVLFLQGCLFYLPHLIWKSIEGKQLENILQGLNVFSLDEDSKKKKTEILVKHLKFSVGLNRKYVFGYFSCEILNFLNVIGQLFLMNSFFGGMFLELGSKVLFLPTKEDESRNDALIQRFPRITKCNFEKYGPSGTIEEHDLLCILPQNLLNEKIFLVMWIWFIFLSCTTGLQLLYRLALFKSYVLRIKLMENRGKIASTYEFHELIRSMRLGDYFLLDAVARNVATQYLRDILIMLTNSNGKPLSNALEKNASPNFAGSENRGYYPNIEGLDTVNMRLRKKALEEDEM